ncbi:MAG: PDZ domain-containing protein [Myxococcales bacterium FL481]|nr:MAG: PDZ domain-containing protein [Myxococcales bacterium FL481]
MRRAIVPAFVSVTASLVLSSFVLGAACATEAGARSEDGASTSSPAEPTESTATLAKYEPRNSLAPMLERVMPSVVSIRAKASRPEQAQPGLPEGMPHWFAPMAPRGRPRAGVGSGFIIDASGVVVTNHHVVDEHDVFEVSLQDERVVSASVIGTDPLTDLALLQLEGVSNLPTVQFGSSDDIRIGDWVVAVGSPMGLEQTASTGIISGKGRGSLNLYRSSYIDFLQTDAPISPGSSGGPLFDLNGRVVGINTAINGVGQSLGFAIPASQAKRIIAALRKDGSVARGWLGIAGRNARPAVGEEVPPGAIVGAVQPNTPAERGGLEPDDRIVAINGDKVRDFEDFRGRIAEYAPGSKVTFRVFRGDQEKKLTVTLGKRPSEDELARRARGERGDRDRPSGSLYDNDRPRLGVDVRSADGKLTIQRVLENSLADRLGLQTGDEIVSVNGVKIRKVEDVAQGLRRDLGRVEVQVRRGKETQTLVVERG